MNNSKLYINLSAPSNIALVKYWGKKNGQKPINPSLSLTLNNCQTHMEVVIEKSDFFDLSIEFESIPNEKFRQKILHKISKLGPEFEKWLPAFSNLKYTIKSYNSFPHSSGIASSASSMAALSFVFKCVLEQFYKIETNRNEWSSLARQLSGSASRSVDAPFMAWGIHQKYFQLKDDYALNLDNILEQQKVHPDFKNMHDAIVIVDAGVKSVSSSDGHALMDRHPHRESRIALANLHFEQIIEAMVAGNFLEFADILEREALDLHAMMMTSSPSVILLKPNSLKVIDWVRRTREQEKINISFTIDAGPNIHLIYLDKDREKVLELLKAEQAKKMDAIFNNIIFDHQGTGPMIHKLHWMD